MCSDVSGYTETVVSLRGLPIPSDAHENGLTLCQVRRELFNSTQTVVQRALSSPGDLGPVTALDRAQAYFLQGQLHSYQGDMAPAIEAFEKARQIAMSDVPDLRLQLDEALGIAHLHKAELENGVFHAPGERCLLLGKGRQPFGRTADVAKAIDYFSRYLAEKSDELEVRWLLNVAHMFAGSYPDEVPTCAPDPARRPCVCGGRGAVRGCRATGGIGLVCLVGRTSLSTISTTTAGSTS